MNGRGWKLKLVVLGATIALMLFLIFQPEQVKDRKLVAFDDRSAEIINDLGLHEVYYNKEWHVMGYIATSALRHEKIGDKIKCWYEPADYRPSLTQSKMEELLRNNGMVKQADGSWKQGEKR